MKTTKSIIVVLFVLLTAQIASAYYCPSTGRWLSRDPIGEPGFQALETTTIAPRIGNSASSQTGRWIQRDSTPVRSELNIYEFVGNNPIITIDRLGLCQCGPDITKNMTDVLSDVEKQFNDPGTDQKKVCASFNNGGGWDTQLAMNYNLKSSCQPSGSCAGTVTVNGTCYLGSEVSYLLYGKMCALCNISQPMMDLYITGWKLGPVVLGGKPGPYDGQFRGALAWANAGFVGWPNSEKPYSDKDSCSKCSDSYSGKISWHAGGMSGR